MLKPTLRHWLMVAVLGVVWGSSFLGVELALRGITPFWLASSRLVFALVFLGGCWAFLGGSVNPTGDRARRWPWILLIGALSYAIPFSLLSWGQQYVASGFAGVCMAAIPLILLPLAHTLLPDEKASWRKVLGFVVGFVGVTLLFGGQIFASSGSSLEGVGRMACLLAACCYALSTICIRRTPKMDPLAMTTLITLAGAGICCTMAWLVEGPPPMPSMQTMKVLVLLGMVQTALANLLRTVVVREAGATFMSMTNYQVPVWSILFGVWFLDEAWSWSLLAALCFILAGVAISQWKPKQMA